MPFLLILSFIMIGFCFLHFCFSLHCSWCYKFQNMVGVRIFQFREGNIQGYQLSIGFVCDGNGIISCTHRTCRTVYRDPSWLRSSIKHFQSTCYRKTFYPFRLIFYVFIDSIYQIDDSQKILNTSCLLKYYSILTPVRRSLPGF